MHDRPRRPPAGWRLALAVGCLLALAVAPARAESTADRAEGPHIAVRLLAERKAVRPGETLRLGVLVQTDPNWHVYWKQAGDAGLPPKLTWMLPEGFRAGPQRWPLPTLHEVGPLVAYLYDDDVLLPVEVQVPFDVGPEPVELAVRVDWLVCEDDQGCIPGEATLRLTLPVTHTAPAPSAAAPRFARTWQDLPGPPPPSSRFEVDDTGATITLEGEGPWQDAAARFEVFWARWMTFDPLAEPYVSRENGRVTLRYDFAQGQKRPEDLEALLVVRTGETRRAFTLQWAPPATGDDAAPAAKRDTAAEPDTPEAPPAAADDDLSWAASYVEYDQGGTDRSLLLALLLAFLGGIFLNVMPCVLPVLSLKILGFVDQAGGDAVRTRRHGYAFAAGVIGAFLAVAGLLLVLRATGEDVGWGFQLQVPAVVAGLALLMFAIGLNLAGVFEIGQGLTGLAGRAASRTEGKGYLGSVWMGILATVIATPCTAPFMGPAIGYALTQSALGALLVFTALGTGMAAPYVLLAVFPQWLRFLPKPGAWMETLKHLMAFPMFATVIWLTWVFGRQVGSDAVAALLVGLLLFALGAWLYGRFGTGTTPPAKRWIVGRAMAAATAVVGVVLALSVEPPSGDGPADHVTSAPDGWVAYDGHLIRAEQEAGRPVFVDFTADWCLTCKANEAAFLETEAVRSAFARHGVTAMQADWTRHDARITKALARLDRNSIPLYVIVPPDPDAPAVVLRTAITTDYVVGALDKVLTPAAR